MEQAHRKGLRKKIVFSLLIVGFVPVFVGLVITYWNGTFRLREAIGENFQGLAVEASRKTDLVMQMEIEEKKHLSIAGEIQATLHTANRGYAKLSEAEVRAVFERRRAGWEESGSVKREILLNSASSYLRNYMLRKPVKYIAFFVTDEQGAVTASANGFPGFLHRDEAWWKETYDDGLGKVHISDLYFSEEAQAYAVNVAVPVMDDTTGKAVGVLAVVHDISELLQLPIHSIRFGKTGHAMLIDSHGRVLTCPFLPTGTFLNQELVDHVTSSTPGWVTARDDGHNGRDSIIGFAPVADTSAITQYSTGRQWHAFIRQDPKELYAPIRSLLLSVSLSGVGLIGFVAFLGVVLSKRLARPIQILHEGAEEIGKGNLDVRLEIRTNDEIEQLADEFNRMAEKLKESHATLEHRVSERTRQLSALNAIATTTNRSLEPKEILESALDTVLEVMQFQAGAIWLWEGQDQDLVLQISRGLPPDVLKRYKEMRVEDTVAGSAARSGHPMIVDDAHSSPGDQTLTEQGFVSVVAIPLRSKDRVLGALTGASRVPRSYSRQDLSLLDSIAHQLSIAIDNATLYIKTRAMVDQLREADRFKTEFFSNISHELKTPLTAINGYSELLLAGMGGELSGTQCEYIANIQSSGTLLLDIINNLLDLSRIRAGKMELDLSEVSVTSVISKAIKAVNPLAAKKAQSLQTDLPDESLVLQADEHKVQHILLNLLSNAVKFTPHGGSIVVKARAATLASQPAVELSVIDNGVGIKPEDHGRIFEEFTQADSSHTREHTGSGLGLAIVKRFVEMHEGVITVDSQPGKGSRFTALLPRRIDLESAAGPGEALDHLTLGPSPGRGEWVDAMTGLPNEAYLRDRLDRCLQPESEEQSVALLMVRIDGFADYNARHGRSAGDVAIQKLARLLRCQLHESDMVCRCYGSTFGIVLPDNTTTEAAATVARRLRHVSPSDSLTLSVGIVGWSADRGSGMAWLERGTRALAEEDEGGSHIST